ncbi:hypothetical protein [Streptomyces nigra]|uniref:hypothetical protein n=1 Tax=Streptomyces nigra TaxID=1827580 RepID=UPI003421163F
MPEDFEDVPEPEDDTIEDTVDETGVDPRDIEAVMNETGASRARAVRALKESGGDLINAIMAAGGWSASRDRDGSATSTSPGGAVGVEQIPDRTIMLGSHLG